MDILKDSEIKVLIKSVEFLVDNRTETREGEKRMCDFLACPYEGTAGYGSRREMFVDQFLRNLGFLEYEYIKENI